MPGSKRVLVALSEMRRERQHMAIVVDEYGGTDGIVTLEDLIEEVIGDIRDEYDAPGGEEHRLVGGVVEVDGKVNLDEVADLTGLELPEGPYSTVGGFIMARSGELPQRRARPSSTTDTGSRWSRWKVAPCVPGADHPARRNR